MAMFAVPALAKQLRRGFPRTLHGTAVYLPVRNAMLRESLDRWFQANKIEPLVLGEFEDRELLKTFGTGGLAAFPASVMIESDVRKKFGVQRVGWLRGVRETYYAIAVQRRVMHPAVQRLFVQATRGLRGRDPSARESH
jgi:LysR family transcriptional regulator, transcriptional activator of nhaA